MVGPLARKEHLMKYESQLRMTMNGLRRDEVTCHHQDMNELPIRKSQRTGRHMLSDKTRKRCTMPLPRTHTKEHCLTIAEVSFHNLRGSQAQTLISTTYQCSIIFFNMGSFNRKSEFRKAENSGKPISSNEK